MNGFQLPTRRLVSQENAAVIENARVPRSRFEGSWTRKTAFDADYLVPIMVDELLPGDHMKYDVTAYVRMSTPLFPLLDQQTIDTFFFFVPARLLWTNWNRFMGEQPQPGDSIDYTIPQVQSGAGGFPVGGLADHFGLPTVGQIGGGLVHQVNALPFRAYNLIWNQWFRDENLQSPTTVSLGNGPDYGPSTYGLLKRAKAADYFTTALPWPQKFTPPVLPFGTTAPVLGIGIKDDATIVNDGGLYWEANGNLTPFLYNVRASEANKVVIRTPNDLDAIPEIYADLTNAGSVSINTLREAIQIQGLLERDARGGTRYTEVIRSHFGVINPDFRLQRPEYIGGGRTPLQITPVAQTAPTEGQPVGALGAAGTAVGSHSASYAATEHGYVIGLINVRSELSYQQGQHRMWSRQTRYDFYWPALADLGEQSILRKEIYATADPTNDDAVFGYQERWHEYRTRTSEVVGIMRSTATGTLDTWHLAERFNTAPLLNGSFVASSTPMARVLAAGSTAEGQQYIGDLLIRRVATRPIPMFGTPATLGRF